MIGGVAFICYVTQFNTAITTVITASLSHLWTKSVLVSPDTQIRSLQLVQVIHILSANAHKKKEQTLRKKVQLVTVTSDLWSDPRVDPTQ